MMKKREANKVYAIKTNYVSGCNGWYDDGNIMTDVYDSISAAKDALAKIVAEAESEWKDTFGEDAVGVKWSKDRRCAVVECGDDTYECKIVEFNLVSSK